MAIPDFQTIMLPLLQLLGDKNEHSLRETIDMLADHFALSEAERKQTIASGPQSLFYNRVGWARTHLRQAGLLEATRRGYFRITQRGVDTLKQKPAKINTAYLKQFPEFMDFQKAANKPAEPGISEVASEQTPEETIGAAYQRLRQGLAAELVQTVKGCSPAFFEQLVVDLLVKMGYGGTRQDAGKAIGKSGDEGIDGIINEDRLGLDIVYIQAKRWDGGVGRQEIQKFTGALAGQHARKGIFITTSSFSKDAREYVSRVDSKIVLIDGDTLAQLMIDYGIGVATVTTYDLKRVDSDYFSEE